MKTATFKPNPQHKILMALLSKCGIGGEQRHELVAVFTGGRTASTKDLFPEETALLISRLQNSLPLGGSGWDYEMDKLRKRVIAVIGKYLTKMQISHDIFYIKSIAERAASAKFNKIPKQKLIGIYSAFNQRLKTIDFSEKITAAHFENLANLN